MAANPSGQGFQNKNRVAILAELDKEKRKLLMQNQSSTNHPGASIALSRPSLNKDFRDHAEQQHIAAQQKAALQHAHAHSSGYFITQDSAFGNLILPVLPRLDPEWRKDLWQKWLEYQMPKLLSFSALQTVTFRILVNFYTFIASLKERHVYVRAERRVSRRIRALGAVVSEELVLLPVTVLEHSLIFWTQIRIEGSHKFTPTPTPPTRWIEYIIVHSRLSWTIYST